MNKEINILKLNNKLDKLYLLILFFCSINYFISQTLIKYHYLYCSLFNSYIVHYASFFCFHYSFNCCIYLCHDAKYVSKLLCDFIRSIFCIVFLFFLFFFFVKINSILNKYLYA